MQYLIYHLTFKEILDPDTRFNKKKDPDPGLCSYYYFTTGILTRLRDLRKNRSDKRIRIQTFVISLIPPEF